MHRTPNKAQNTQQKLGVAFSYLECDNPLPTHWNFYVLIVSLPSYITVHNYCISFLCHLTAILMGNVVGTLIGQISKTQNVVDYDSLHRLNIVISLLSIIKGRWQTISLSLSSSFTGRYG